MSLINDALKRARIEQLKNETQQDQSVVHVPRSGVESKQIKLVLFYALPGVIFLLLAGLWLESFSRHQSEKNLSNQIQIISDQQNDLMKRLYANNDNIDARTQLDLFDLRTRFEALSSKVGLMGLADMDTFKSQMASNQKELKDEIFYINQRFHNVAHDNAILSERLALLEKTTASSSSDSKNN